MEGRLFDDDPPVDFFITELPAELQDQVLALVSWRGSTLLFTY